MRFILAILASAVPIVLLFALLIPWVDSGVPFDRAGRSIGLKFGWAGIVVSAVFFANLFSGAIAKWIDRKGDAVRFLILVEIMRRVVKFIAKLLIAPKTIPDGMDIATEPFKSARPFLSLPAWYILVYGLATVAGLNFGSRIISGDTEGVVLSESAG